jgi:hypothetical protein
MHIPRNIWSDREKQARPEMYHLTMRITGEVETSWTCEGLGDRPNEHQVGPRKCGPARMVALLTGSTGEVQTLWRGEDTDNDTNQHGIVSI